MFMFNLFLIPLEANLFLVIPEVLNNMSQIKFTHLTFSISKASKSLKSQILLEARQKSNLPKLAH